MLERLKRLCAESGTNFSALEKELGLANGSLSKTSEKTQCGRIYALARYFDVSMEYLLTGKKNEEHITNEEYLLIQAYRKMNTSGKALLDAQVNMISRMPEYQIQDETLQISKIG